MPHLARPPQGVHHDASRHSRPLTLHPLTDIGFGTSFPMLPGRAWNWKGEAVRALVRVAASCCVDSCGTRWPQDQRLRARPKPLEEAWAGALLCRHASTAGATSTSAATPCNRVERWACQQVGKTGGAYSPAHLHQGCSAAAQRRMQVMWGKLLQMVPGDG